MRGNVFTEPATAAFVHAVNVYVRVLDTVADAERILSRALEIEVEEHSAGWDGWEWDDVPAAGSVLARLVTLGALRITYRSQRYTSYMLADAGAARAALSVAPPPTAAPVEVGPLPADLFGVVVGHDRVKEHLRLCLEADRPVHALLVGPFATAKSLFLLEMERLPGARFVVPQASSRKGLEEVLTPGDVRYLLLDEIEKAAARDLSILLTLMETGRLLRDKHGSHLDVRFPLWVFAAANRTTRMAPELLSRFLPLRLENYSDAEHRRVIAGFLVQREHVDEELAWEIATLVEPRTHDVRRARDIARLCAGDRKLAAQLVAELL